MNLRKKTLILITILLASIYVNAGDQFIQELKIKKIRAVGNYNSGETFDDTLELWFTSGLVFSEDVTCTTTFRVYVDAAKNHMVSAAYMAYASGKTVGILVDDTLPKRGGACEISFIDVND